ncbi:MAG: hypothetical protein AAGH83_01465 [Pseudomonadota bacterium]
MFGRLRLILLPAAFMAVVGCGSAIGELPCDGDARNCEPAELPTLGAGGGSARLPDVGPPVDLVSSQSACPPGRAEACVPTVRLTSERRGVQGRPAGTDRMEAVRLRTRSTALNAELSRLPAGDSIERRRIERQQQRIDNRVRTIETPYLRVPPPGVSF